TADLKALMSNVGKYGSIPQGDFNGDGKVDFADFQELERNYGKRSATGLYQPFGAMTAASDELLVQEPAAPERIMTASGDEVLANGVLPEPGTLGMIMLAGMGVL